MIKLLPTLLTVLFIGLKLTGYITWSWLWVLSPLWIPLAFIASLFVFGYIYLGHDEFMKAIQNRNF